MPAFKHLFETRLKLGEYQGHPLRKFTFNEKGKKFCFGKDTDLSKETIIELWSAWEQSREDKKPQQKESFASRAMQERGVKVQKVQQAIDSERRPAP